ncbi:hypothetical protein CNR22_22700 [Sphingobacteriaceae bacterium]|nr:hypothetical protein CNR22_22700 [Sphingobacteriaceae bacterium]
MKKIISLSVLFLLFVASCKKQKDLPEPEINDPHFYVNCTMDGQPFNIAAGDDDYYMNTSSYFQDSDHVYVYKANLARQNSSGYQVTILFNETQETTVYNPMKVDSTLVKGKLLYNDLIIDGTTQVLTFKAAKINSSAAYKWSCTDGTNTTTRIGSGTLHATYSATLDVGKTYSVTLNYDDASGTCTQSLTNVFRIGNKLQTGITATKISSNEFKYQFFYLPVDAMFKNLQSTWSFSNGGIDTRPSPEKLFVFNTTNLVTLNLTDLSTGDSCIYRYQIHATNGSVCDANFRTEFSPIINTRIPSSVTILVTDPNGKVYSSKNLIQPQSSNFDITEVAEYNLNEKGEHTKSLKVKFNCIVKNGTTEINLKDGNAKVAVSYK